MRLYERGCGTFAVLWGVRFQPSGVRFAGFVWLRRVTALPRGYERLHGHLRGLLGGRVLWRLAGLFGAAALLRKPQYQRLEQHFVCADISYRVERFLLTLHLNDNEMKFVLLRISRLVPDKNLDPYSENKSSATFCHNKTETRRVLCYDHQRPN